MSSSFPPNLLIACACGDELIPITLHTTQTFTPSIERRGRRRVARVCKEILFGTCITQSSHRKTQIWVALRPLAKTCCGTRYKCTYCVVCSSFVGCTWRFELLTSPFLSRAAFRPVNSGQLENALRTTHVLSPGVRKRTDGRTVGVSGGPKPGGIEGGRDGCSVCSCV